MRKQNLFIGLAMSFAFILASCDSNLDVPETLTNKQETVKEKCTTIQSGELTDSQGNVITPGYNENGYNYQAHIYNGEYSPGWNLVMKWNDAWLSNQDCDGDGKLDRPLDENDRQYYFGSGAWCTNHWTTTYTDVDGNECVYDEFIKIVAVPEDAGLTDGYWYAADGKEIGENIWGQFAIIQYIVNDPCEGVEGVQYKSPDHPGLGNW